MTLKMIVSDDRNRRVYYKEGAQLYCYQQSSFRPIAFTLLACGQDMEPTVAMSDLRPIDRLPDDLSDTSKTFSQWAREQHLI